VPKTKKKPSLYDHSLEECERVSTEHLDNCPECGELIACVCLASIVEEWEIAPTGSEGRLAYRFEYKEKGGIIFYFGYASTYREAMDSIAHSVLCKRKRVSA